jgi:urocanate hydratase
LAFDSNVTAAFDAALRVERLFAALIQSAAAGSSPNAKPELGGKLLYAGELDAEGCALTAAANIAGAASLAATADQAVRKQAMREGVVDFLVTSLDEALRILKNEIRKRTTVAVCVADAPEIIEREMRERGVLPDLLRPGAEAATACAAFLSQGARQIQIPHLNKSPALLAWRVAAAPAQWLPKLNGVALDCLQANTEHEDWAARRWLRLAPRYQGRQTQGVRLLRCNDETARRFLERVRDQVERGEIEVAVEISLTGPIQTTQHRFSPPAR